MSYRKHPNITSGTSRPFSTRKVSPKDHLRDTRPAEVLAVLRRGETHGRLAHQFRATASTLLNEAGLRSADAIEGQLAYVEDNEVGALTRAASIGMIE